ncbi:unnamed protein product [Sphagnum balticum]
MEFNIAETASGAPPHAMSLHYLVANRLLIFPDFTLLEDLSPSSLQELLEMMKGIAEMGVECDWIGVGRSRIAYRDRGNRTPGRGQTGPNVYTNKTPARIDTGKYRNDVSPLRGRFGNTVKNTDRLRKTPERAQESRSPMRRNLQINVRSERENFGSRMATPKELEHQGNWEEYQSCHDKIGRIRSKLEESLKEGNLIQLKIDEYIKKPNNTEPAIRAAERIYNESIRKNDKGRQELLDQQEALEKERRNKKYLYSVAI